MCPSCVSIYIMRTVGGRTRVSCAARKVCAGMGVVDERKTECELAES